MSIEHTFESGPVFVLSQQPYLYFLRLILTRRKCIIETRHETHLHTRRTVLTQVCTFQKEMCVFKELTDFDRTCTVRCACHKREDQLVYIIIYEGLVEVEHQFGSLCKIVTLCSSDLYCWVCAILERN